MRLPVLGWGSRTPTCIYKIRFLRQILGEVLLIGSLIVSEFGRWMHDDCSELWFVAAEKIKLCPILVHESFCLSKKCCLLILLPARRAATTCRDSTYQQMPPLDGTSLKRVIACKLLLNRGHASLLTSRYQFCNIVLLCRNDGWHRQAQSAWGRLTALGGVLKSDHFYKAILNLNK